MKLLEKQDLYLKLNSKFLNAVSAVDYSIPYANVDIQVYDDGLINVYEEIDYHFDSSANGVYRDIPLKRNQSVENLHVYVE